MDSAAADHDDLDVDVGEVLNERLSQVQLSRDPREWAELSADLCDEWRLEEAIACARTAIRLGCDAAAFDLGRALSRQDRDEEAIQAYQQAIDAGVVEAILNQGSLWQYLGDLEQARQRYQQAIEAGDLLGHIRLGQLLETAGQLAQAEAHFRIAVQSRWPSASSALGLLLARQESWAETEPLLRAAAESPDDAEARSWLGLTLRRLGRIEEARAVLTAAADADEWQSFIPLGNLLRDEDDDPVGAEEAYRRAREAGDENAYLNLGLLLLEVGQLDAARAELALALDQGGRNRTAALAALTRIADDEDARSGEPAPEDLDGVR